MIDILIINSSMNGFINNSEINLKLNWLNVLSRIYGHWEIISSIDNVDSELRHFLQRKHNNVLV